MDFTKLSGDEHRLLTLHAELRAVEEILAHRHSMTEIEIKKWEGYKDRLVTEVIEREMLSNESTSD